ncbi:D-amino acid oxidase [Aspergillus nomiae NRRL 13137]|uniref:D-amino acid oxidase n=1 Tax=Aspergillus nomiae NRRL (strain ATCC 15546 / NRRL 13137 / CBS 260.88 / M93) TaxID=1509407 RepID=A0A0L1JCN5_ASPN3|nr:D-amino acid oxidase [Aspergillus nomiae NRRL 13137]KNG89495.1 D-amino acid oxidase [Aspergillus nomiae NRRL 13137]
MATRITLKANPGYPEELTLSTTSETPEIPKKVQNRSKHVLVIGGGVSGLMTAWILLDKGYSVTIVSKEWASLAKPLTSQIAGALWEYPPGGCGITEIETPLFGYSTLEQYREWAMQSFEFYQMMADRDEHMSDGLERTSGVGKFGVKMKTLFQFFQRPIEDESRVHGRDDRHYDKYFEMKTLDESVDSPFRGQLKVKHHCMADVNGRRKVKSQGLADLVDPKRPFGVACAYQHAAPMIDTDVAMAFLMSLVQSKGAVLETRQIKGDLRLHEQELLSEYNADIIVNASGIGARELANDPQIFPVRGAVRKIKRPEGYPVDHAFLLPAQINQDGSVSKTVFIVPRNDDTLVIGSITQRNNWQLNLSLDSPEVKAMWERATEFLPVLKDADHEAQSLAQGLRPFSYLNVRVSADSRANTCRIVHNYGHGGSGWTLAVGCARTCVRLVEEILDTGRSANAGICRL